MNTKDKCNKLTSLNCTCDICQCFNIPLENEQLEYVNEKYKLNDNVKLWNRFEGIVKFIGHVNFTHDMTTVFLIGIELNSHIPKITLNNYDLYCDRMKRILVPPSFCTRLAPGRRGHPQTKGLQMNPSYNLIRRNRQLYKTM
ncbi:unnamed protein product [Trichobilharzia szidati]|nr:unnamed protein product [Trichobilharzia szidati]